jgi:hypothetical protein
MVKKDITCCPSHEAYSGLYSFSLMSTAYTLKVTIFWLENLKGRGHMGDLGIDGKILLKKGLREIGCKAIY